MEVLSIETVLENILKEGIDIIDKEEAKWLLQNKELCGSLVVKQISQVFEQKEAKDSEALYWLLQLSGFFAEERAFPWLCRLCTLPEEEIGEWMGDTNFFDDLPYILFATAGSQFDVLMKMVEGATFYIGVREAALRALTYMVATGKIERERVMDFLRSIMQEIVQGKREEDEFVTSLVASISSIWPSECLEEIKECFGLRLVDTMYISIQDVFCDIDSGEEECLKKLQKEIQQQGFLEQFFSGEDEKIGEIQQFTKRMFELFSANEVANKSIKKAGRNETCTCGSGKKYKKCCKNIEENRFAHIFSHEGAIVYETLQDSPMQALPEIVKERISELYYESQEISEEVLEELKTLIKTYPHVPQLYNYVIVCYKKMNQPREAIQWIKETLKKFPDYLFAKIDYATYFLDRGEPEKMLDPLFYAYTLKQLYPSRNEFHISEYTAFYYIRGLYSLHVGDTNLAKAYLHALQEKAPNFPLVENLRKKISSTFFMRALTSV